MYWIYLFIFIFAVLVPELIVNDLGSLGEERVEELAIFLLFFLGFLLYQFKDFQRKRDSGEKIEMNKELLLVSKDLKDSYSYIGEVNRKLDIVKKMILETNFSNQKAKRNNVFDKIIEAIKTITWSNKFVIRIINTKNNNTTHEVVSQKKLEIKITNSELYHATKDGIYEIGDFFFFSSPKEINNNRAYIIFKKERSIQVDDRELMKTIATQSLVFFTLCVEE